MVPVPPTALILSTLQQAVLPAVGGAAFVTGLFLVFGRWAGALGSAAAVTLAYSWANFTFHTLSWDERTLLLPWKPEDGRPGTDWIPRAALVLIIIGLVSRWAGLALGRALKSRYWWGANLLVWAPRIVGVVVVSGWLVVGPAAQNVPWLRPALIAVMLANWVVLDGVARPGAGGQVAAYQAAILLAAGLILLYAHTAKFMSLGIVMGFAMLGVAVVTGPAKADASGAVPAGVAFLPGLMLAVPPSLPKPAFPAACFWLVVLAPLTLAPFLFPALARSNGWVARLVRAVLIITPLVIAVALADRYEKIVYPGQDW